MASQKWYHKWTFQPLHSKAAEDWRHGHLPWIFMPSWVQFSLTWGFWGNFCELEQHGTSQKKYMQRDIRPNSSRFKMLKKKHQVPHQKNKHMPNCWGNHHSPQKKSGVCFFFRFGFSCLETKIINRSQPNSHVWPIQHMDLEVTFQSCSTC